MKHLQKLLFIIISFSSLFAHQGELLVSGSTFNAEKQFYPILNKALRLDSLQPLSSIIKTQLTNIQKKELNWVKQYIVLNAKIKKNIILTAVSGSVMIPTAAYFIPLILRRYTDTSIVRPINSTYANEINNSLFSGSMGIAGGASATIASYCSYKFNKLKKEIDNHLKKPIVKNLKNNKVIIPISCWYKSLLDNEQILKLSALNVT